MALEIDSARPGPGALLSRIARSVRVAPEGAAIALSVAAIAIVLLVAGLQWPGLAALAGAIALALFLRDPDRFPERTDGVVLSGADGRVCDLGEASMPTGAADERSVRVSIFMSPLNVHVNRAPVGGAVAQIEHTAGEFLAAFGDDASAHNERNLIVLSDAAGRNHAMVQVAGYFARRIVCRVRARDKVVAAQRVGLIMFGSRVDHYLPRGFRPRVKPGDRVRAGITVIGELER